MNGIYRFVERDTVPSDMAGPLSGTARADANISNRGDGGLLRCRQLHAGYDGAGRVIVSNAARKERGDCGVVRVT